MKGLRKIIYPFAPDQSGATSVFYELGGIIVICDAGGCAGNVCGFDEPRWFVSKSMIFSAGLRDMDAILGRDRQMVDKMADAAQKLDAKFAVVIGTPVPATIATDYRAVKRMAEKKLGIPVMTVDTNGIRWYDHGAEKAYTELFETFAGERAASDEPFSSRTEPAYRGRIGVLGATPLDLGSLSAPQRIERVLKERGADEVVCYGFGSTLEDVKRAAEADCNLVIAPSGLRAAKYLQKHFGVPYTCGYPILEDVWHTPEKEMAGKRILIVHQQVLANELRNRIRKTLGREKLPQADITAATWFMQKRELKEEGDRIIPDEDRFVEMIETGSYDVIIADRSLKKAVSGFDGEWIHLPHFAVSGELEDKVIPEFYT